MGGILVCSLREKNEERIALEKAGRGSTRIVLISASKRAEH